MQISELVIQTLTSEFFSQNSYIVYNSGNKNCLVIDAGFDVEQIINFLKKNELNPAAILVTHGHMDHVAGNDGITKVWPDCKVYIGEHDAYKLVDPQGNLSESLGVSLSVSPPDFTLEDGDNLTIADIPVTVSRIPGHSKGHVVYNICGTDGSVVFVGDVIFYDSIGRSDFVDGNHGDLIDGIRDKILVLPGNTVLYPGHGPETTVERERQYNHFLQDDAI